MTHPDFQVWAKYHRQQVEDALDSWMPQPSVTGLGQAMRYAVMGGGKRLRPLLVFASAKASDGLVTQANVQAVLRAAVAVELIHAYSLVHDDMPCMDNDVLRRGKPTVHISFGQAHAMLVGDALQALAFEVLTAEKITSKEMISEAISQARLCRLLAQAAGEAGMVGGQAIDLNSVKKPIDLLTLEEMHCRKTGALINASLLMGAAANGVAEETAIWQVLNEFGQALGLAFQIVDDILDTTSTSSTLGKTPGKDFFAQKPTYVSLLGIEGAKVKVLQLQAQALNALEKITWPMPISDNPLVWLMDYVVNREN